jgi:hypothetical protein
MSETAKYRPELDRLQRAALVIGGAGVVACLAGAAQSRQEFFEAYLLGFVFWAGVAAGCLALLMLHQMFGAGWGFAIQRIAEAGTRTLPLVAVLFVPLLFGLHNLYEWSHAEAVAADELLRHKSAYLNTGFFAARAAIYFAVWMGFGWLMLKTGAELERTGNLMVAERLRNLSAPGLILYGLTATFAAVDWVMSLEPHWFSTIFGLIFIVGHMLATFCVAILMVRMLSRHEPYSERVGAQQYHDLGNLTLAFTMLWAYMSISQYLIIWSGNLPETISWFQHRSRGGWEKVAVLLMALNFALPFLLLLSRTVKRRIEALARVALVILAMRLVDLFWVIKPAFHKEGFALSWMDVAAPVGIGGLWLAYFLRQLKSRPVLPEGDPRMERMLKHAGGH